MNISANSNMYFHDIEEAWMRFGAHLGGNRDGLICAIGNTALSEDAQRALVASMERLGYGRDACTFIAVFGKDSGTEKALSPRELFELIEGLDPALLIIADAEAARLIGEAFRTQIPLQESSFVAGRTTVAFRSFQSMLLEAADKQKAWALLKRLTR